MRRREILPYLYVQSWFHFFNVACPSAGHAQAICSGYSGMRQLSTSTQVFLPFELSMLTIRFHVRATKIELELELERIQTQMAQKPKLRAEVYASALRARQNVRESGVIGGRAMCLMSGRGVGECGSGRHSYGVDVISEVGWLSLC